MKRFFSGKQLMLAICLLFTVGILFLNSSATALAMENTDSLSGRETNLTGTTDTRTNINEPGSAEDADDLKELNVANNLTITYDNGNGNVAGPVRILIILTMIRSEEHTSELQSQR